MAVTSGFFNSQNGDRKYNAEQMSSIFDGVINDGVFANVGKAFGVSPATDISVSIDVGRAWFNNVWIYNDAIINLATTAASQLLDRYDAVVIEVDKSVGGRKASIKVITGTPATAPKKPTMVKTKEKNQYPLAYILRSAGSTTITTANIENKIGSSECPYVTGILQVQNTDNITAQWKAQLTDYMTGEQARFVSWFNGIQEMLNGNDTSALAALVHKERNYIYIALPTSGWSNSSPYTQTVAASGVKSTDVPTVGLHTEGIASVDVSKKLWRAFSYIDRVEMQDGKVKVWCYRAKPAMHMTLVVKGVI